MGFVVSQILHFFHGVLIWYTFSLSLPTHFWKVPPRPARVSLSVLSNMRKEDKSGFLALSIGLRFLNWYFKRLLKCWEIRSHRGFQLDHCMVPKEVCTFLGSCWPWCFIVLQDRWKNNYSSGKIRVVSLNAVTTHCFLLQRTFLSVLDINIWNVLSLKQMTLHESFSYFAVSGEKNCRGLDIKHSKVLIKNTEETVP